ncbi:hypothetical protein ACQKOE_07290 [Novosphingobium sp. NPDC080210]|uniref:hypothetical protein n=1 Tax=Novosphingobium sp. NPDC080210 TaxID=3390596 RepID=UPI003CFE907C
MSQVEVKPRRRAGSADVFERRYGPVDSPDGNMIWEHKDLPKDIEERNVWTLVDCDGTLYVVPGYHTVNYFGRVVTERQWSDVEEMNPGYVW